jgi:ABC-type branched-subunit amino acid transport system permease subunit
MRAAFRYFLVGPAILLGLVLVGKLLPGWCVFLLVTAFAKGLTALGLVILLRSGLLSFGQGLFYCAGGYGAGLLTLWTGIRDVNLMVAAGGCLGLVIGLVVGPLLARYRGIFFATLTLALSMLVYGGLAKTDALGGTDGLNFPPPTFFGYLPRSSDQAVWALYLYTSALVVIVGVGCHIHFNSVRGLLSIAARDNEIRVEYLGMSVRRIVIENFVASAFLGGVGGALNAIAISHIDPELAFWTTSGELTFVAVLGGPFSVPAAFVSSILIEFTRSLSGLYFPNAWQMSLGIFMLVSILFVPAGLGSIFRRHRKPAAEIKT